MKANWILGPVMGVLLLGCGPMSSERGNGGKDPEEEKDKASGCWSTTVNMDPRGPRLVCWEIDINAFKVLPLPLPPPPPRLPNIPPTKSITSLLSWSSITISEEREDPVALFFSNMIKGDKSI